MCLPFITEKIELLPGQKPLITPKLQYDKKKRTVIIVGAGLAGLSAANELLHLQEKYFGSQSLKDLDITILEARNRVGGRVWTVREFSIPIEAGANELHHPDYENLTFKLARKFNLPLKYHPIKFDSTKETNIQRGLIDSTQSVKNNKITFVSEETYDALGDYYEQVFEFITKNSNNLEKFGLSKNSTVEKLYEVIEKHLNLKSQEKYKHIPEYLYDYFKKESFDGIGAAISDMTYEDMEIQGEGYSQQDIFNLPHWQFQQYLLDQFNDYFIFEKGYDTIPKKWAAELVGQGIQLKLNHVVNSVDYAKKSGVEISCNDKHILSSDKVICAFPIEVRERMQFTPETNQKIKASEHKVEQGTYLKIPVEFDKPFWPEGLNGHTTWDHVKQTTSENNLQFRYMYNRYAETGVPLLMPILNGKDGHKVEKMIKEMGYDKALKEVTRQLMQTLKDMFALDKLPQPKLINGKPAIKIIDWRNDRFSKGAWSFTCHGGTVKDRELLSQPYAYEGENKVFFAGSYLDDLYCWTTQGAVRFGIDAANKTFASFHKIPMEDMNVRSLYMNLETEAKVTGKDGLFQITFDETVAKEGVFGSRYNCSLKFDKGTFSLFTKKVGDTVHLSMYQLGNIFFTAKKLPDNDNYDPRYLGTWFLPPEKKDDMTIITRLTFDRKLLDEEKNIYSDDIVTVNLERIYRKSIGLDKINLFKKKSH